MSTEPTIDIERLLTPINEESPTGEYLSLSDFGGPLMQIKDAYDEARKLIKEEQDRDTSGGIDSQGQPWRTIPSPDWDTIIDLGTETLESKSKDFRIASWLTEALLRKHKIVGLRDGLELCWGLCERFWADILPQPNEDDGHGATVSAFAGLVTDATYNAVLETTVVFGTKANERSERRYSGLDYTRAKDLETLSLSDERQRRIDLGHIELTEFRSVAALTPSEFHLENLGVVDDCISKLNSIGDFLRENCQEDEYGEPTSPSVSGFREQLEFVRRLIQELRGGGEGAGQQEVETSDGDAHAPIGSVKKDMSREQAFQAVEKIAQFFERTEPHTPVYFTLRQAVRWGRMPFPELLAELIDDRNTMDALRRHIGLPAAQEQGE